MLSRLPELVLAKSQSAEPTNKYRLGLTHGDKIQKMVDVQELISRGRLAFSGAPRRLEVFGLTNGKRSTKEMARQTRRSLPSVLHDIEELWDWELIREKTDSKGKPIREDGSGVYEKAPLAKHIPLSYFEDIARTDLLVKKMPRGQPKTSKPTATHVPSEAEILDICRHGEDQLYEFKAPGTDTGKITKEIAALLHTKWGGIIFYGIEDDGAIIGSDMRRQDLDQKIQNSVRNTISPQPNVQIKDRVVLRSTVLLVIVPPWDRRTIYQYAMDGRYYIRKGTNIFALKPEEISELSKGNYVV
jgi:hypothetical protein